MEIGYTVVPLLIVIVLFAVTFTSVRAIEDVDGDADLTVEVIGFQWQWRFNYPESGVAVVGTELERPELVLPAGATVQFDVTSIDVVHSFWIPGFRYKRDMFPGQVETFQVDITGDTGEYPNDGICAEFCGLDHTTMRFDVRIVTPDEFAQWLEERDRSLRSPATQAVDGRSLTGVQSLASSDVMTADLASSTSTRSSARGPPGGGPACRGRSSAG